MTRQSILDKLREIDPEVKLEIHPTIPFAFRCTPSSSWYLGPLIERMENIRCMGVLVLYPFIGAVEYSTTIVFDVELVKLTRYQRFVRWLAK